MVWYGMVPGTIPPVVPSLPPFLHSLFDGLTFQHQKCGTTTMNSTDSEQERKEAAEFAEKTTTEPLRISNTESSISHHHNNQAQKNLPQASHGNSREQDTKIHAQNSASVSAEQQLTSTNHDGRGDQAATVPPPTASESATSQNNAAGKPTITAAVNSAKKRRPSQPHTGRIPVWNEDTASTIPSPLSSPWNASVYRYPPQRRSHRRNSRRRGKSGASGDASSAYAAALSSSSVHSTTALATVGRVGRQAAFHTKSLVWDSNEPTVNAAAHLVDYWENWYQAARAGLVWGVQQTVTVYGAAKEGASSVERGVWRPLCDWIVLPTWNGAEWIVCQTATFLQSPTARQLAQQCVAQVRQVPIVGPHVLAPALVGGTQLCQRTWHILQYPIPSKHTVRTTVDACLNATKWGLTTAGTHVLWFVKRADAIISRTLSQTQWNILGSGPYWELAPNLRTALLHSLADRYLELIATAATAASRLLEEEEEEDGNDRRHRSRTAAAAAVMARYEWMARIRFQNERLAADLAAFLLENCNSQVSDDEWLHPCPVYRHLQRSFLLPDDEDDYEEEQAADTHTTSMDNHAHLHRSSVTPHRRVCRRALWFYQPAVNGQEPSRDTPWIPFSAVEQGLLEARYIDLVEGRAPLVYGTFTSNLEMTAVKHGQAAATADSNDENETDLDVTLLMSNETNESSATAYDVECSTMAHWYTPNPVTDVCVDQKRHCVTMMAACPRCDKSLEVRGGPPRVATQPSLCRTCQKESIQIPWIPAPPPMAWPAYTARRRPTLWRFYGGGDVVRRSVWFLEHKSAGLQPFDTVASRILEDAYWFLQWRALQEQHAAEPRRSNSITDKEDDNDTPSYDAALLTVEVICPDGAARLVQFSSLSEATAVQKGLGAALTLRKRRVYRGAWLETNADGSSPLLTPRSTVFSAVGSPLGQGRVLSSSDAFLPNVPLRDVLAPPVPVTPRSAWNLSPYGPNPDRHDLSVPPSRFHQDDMERIWLGDSVDSSCNVDHLCLIVHGIGEMLRSIDVFGLSLPNLASIVDCCAFLRRNHAAVQNAQFQQMYPTAQLGETPGRVEYLPVEWHEAFAVLSQRRLRPSAPKTGRPPVLMQDISLRTIPNMRDFANDTLMDVLYFMSPEHHDIMIDIVTREMNTVVNKFRDLTGFRGRISILGHSLGSVLSFDILANQNIDLYEGDQEGFIPGVASETSLDSFKSANTSEQSDYNNLSEMEPERTIPLNEDNTRRPSSKQPYHYEYPQLDFEVDNFFLLGSPVAVFLMIRNPQQPLRENYYLRGCHRVFNIFHPYDPVAYRIEPCLDPRNADFEPTIMPHWNGGFRIQYQSKRLWRKLVDTTYRTQQSVAEAFEASMAGMGLLDTTVEAVAAEHEEDDETSTGTSESENRLNYIVTGQLNQGRRIDYVSCCEKCLQRNHFYTPHATSLTYCLYTFFG